MISEGNEVKGSSGLFTGPWYQSFQTSPSERLETDNTGQLALELEDDDSDCPFDFDFNESRTEEPADDDPTEPTDGSNWGMETKSAENGSVQTEVPHLSKTYEVIPYLCRQMQTMTEFFKKQSSYNQNMQANVEAMLDDIQSLKDTVAQLKQSEPRERKVGRPKRRGQSGGHTTG